MEMYKENFEKWCEDCVKISDKLTGCSVPFRLNSAQKKVLNVMEEMRRTGKPIRLILLKARQWGGSTLIQMYMAWMQLVRHSGRNSLICAHYKDAAANIRGMYTRLLREYPEEMKTDNAKMWSFLPYEKSANINYIASRDCCVAIATALSPNALRGGNFSMAHLSEVAFWDDGDSTTAEQIVRTVAGSIPMTADSMIVMESTANGQNNFFHSEWVRAVEGKSDKVPVFVAWHEIEIYSKPLDDEQKRLLLSELDDYERNLMTNLGVDINHVAWYHDKRREYSSHYQMMSEYPSTPHEAFVASGSKLFSHDELQHLITANSVEMQSRHSDGVVILFAGGNNQAHSVAVCKIIDRKILGKQIWSSSVSMEEALCVAEGFSKAEHLPIAILDDADQSHAKWFLRRAAQKGLSMYFADDLPMVISLSSQMQTAVVDAHRELLIAGKIIESSDCVIDLYQSVRCGQSPCEAALLWCRMSASLLLASRIDAPIAVPADFYPDNEFAYRWINI